MTIKISEQGLLCLLDQLIELLEGAISPPSSVESWTITVRIGLSQLLRRKQMLDQNFKGGVSQNGYFLAFADSSSEGWTLDKIDQRNEKGSRNRILMRLLLKK
jgi:hypothetical protein